jgi:endonuclease/exonuclease/phosphatase family metal-dependent hydrolase
MWISSRKELHRFALSVWHEATTVERLFVALLLFGLLFLAAHWALLLPAASVAGTHMRVATLNIWNLQPIWVVRKQRIAELLDELDADIVGLQELRSCPPDANQLEQLLNVTRRQFATAIFAPATELDASTTEGVGLVSRFKAVDSSQYFFHQLPADEDRLKRTVLRVLLDTPHGLVNVFVTHLSYARSQQCQSFLELKRFMLRPEHQPGVIPQILIGDLNAYTDFEHPTEILTEPSLRPDNPCLSTLRQATQRIMLIQEPGTVTLRNIATNLPLSASSILPDHTIAPRTYNLSQTLLFAREPLALGPTELWRIEPVVGASLPKFTLTTPSGGRLSFAAGDTYVKVREPEPPGAQAQEWFIEREQIGSIRHALQTQFEPIALVLFDHVPRAKSELAVVRGDLVAILDDKSNAEWTRVLHGRTAEGYVPANFLERVDFVPGCPPAWQPVMCRKNIHVVRLRSSALTYLHVRVDIDETFDATTPPSRRGSAHFLSNIIDRPQPELFLMSYEPPLEVSEAELVDAPDDGAIEHAYHEHAVKDVLNSEHLLVDVWPLLNPGQPGFTFSTLPYTDTLHENRSTGLSQRPDRIFLHQGRTCLKPLAVRTFGDDNALAVRFFGRIVFHRLKALWLDVAPRGSLEPTDGVRLFRPPLKPLSVHELRFVKAGYGFLFVWMLWCARRSSICLLCGGVLALMPLWHSIIVVLLFGNEDEFHCSDHAGVVADLSWVPGTC